MKSKAKLFMIDLLCIPIAWIFLFLNALTFCILQSFVMISSTVALLIYPKESVAFGSQVAQEILVNYFLDDEMEQSINIATLRKRATKIMEDYDVN